MHKISFIFPKTAEGMVYYNLVKTVQIYYERGNYMRREKDRYGIPMIQYCREHEEYIKKQLAAGAKSSELLALHEKKLAWLQHERLVHFLVTMLTGVFFIFSVLLGMFLEWSIAVLALQLILFVLLAAYLRHYFKLENMVQHWYRIADEIYNENKGENWEYLGSKN